MKSATILLSLVALGGVLQGCERAVSYQTDVNPLIQKYCVSCHAPEKDGYNVSGLSMTDHQALMKGTKFGPVVIPGDSFTSVMVMLVEGRADPSIKMPHEGHEGPTADEIALIRRWIDQGAKNN
ncbi:MAG: hypothetical protein MUC77_12090 [Chromatiaceae bacterium]|jgi:uncharacterized membrane protein|nr:hypothetical protein [Chromatiaceae bacterium]